MIRNGSVGRKWHWVEGQMEKTGHVLITGEWVAIWGFNVAQELSTIE